MPAYAYQQLQVNLSLHKDPRRWIVELKLKKEDCGLKRKVLKKDEDDETTKIKK